MTSAAARHELYTALKTTLGNENADTLMACLPAITAEELANRAEVVGLRSDLTSLRQETREEFRSLRQEFTGLLTSQIADVHKRLDRIFLAQIATTVALGAALVAI